MNPAAKTLAIAAVALAGALGTGAARAGDVHWSIGINLPVHPNVAIGVSNAPRVVYRPAPVYYGDPVYVGAPVYVAPSPRVVYMPQPVYVRPAYGHRHWKHGKRHRHDGYRDRRWDDDRRWGDD